VSSPPSPLLCGCVCSGPPNGHVVSVVYLFYDGYTTADKVEYECVVAEHRDGGGPEGGGGGGSSSHPELEGARVRVAALEASLPAVAASTPSRGPGGRGR
jgi:hypothetical protein